ncbi:MAG: TrkA family potassium uptake protein [Chloroflexota bacterium]
MKILIVGGDQTAYYLAKRFMKRGLDVTIINMDGERCLELAQQTGATVVHGDGTNVDILEDAGGRLADALLAITPQDQDNLIACQIAKRQFGVPRVIAIVNDPDNERVFRKLGVDVAFSTTRIIGAILDQETSFEEITSLMPLARGRVAVNDVRLPNDSPALGKTLAEIKLTRGSLVACILRDEHVVIPSGETRLLAGDHLLVISQAEDLQTDMEVLLGPDEV